MKYVIMNDGWADEVVPCAIVFSEEITHRQVVNHSCNVLSAGFCNVSTEKVDGPIMGTHVDMPIMIVQVGRPSDTLSVGPADGDGELLTRLILRGETPMDIVRSRRDANE